MFIYKVVAKNWSHKASYFIILFYFNGTLKNLFFYNCHFRRIAWDLSYRRAALENMLMAKAFDLMKCHILKRNVCYTEVLTPPKLSIIIEECIGNNKTSVALLDKNNFKVIQRFLTALNRNMCLMFEHMSGRIIKFWSNQ